MEASRALRFLEEHVGHTPKHARRILCRTNLFVAEKHSGEDVVLATRLGPVSTDKTIGRYPDSHFLGLLAEAGEIGHERAEFLVRHDLTVRETPAELDAMLTQAFFA